MPTCPFKLVVLTLATITVCWLAGQQLQAMYPRPTTAIAGVVR
jgi:hypothetical protein